MLECPNCFAAVHENNNRCLRCGKPISEATAKSMPKQTTKYKEGIFASVLSAVIVLSLVAGIGYGMYRAYTWWTLKKAHEKVDKLSIGKHSGDEYPLLELHLSFKIRGGRGYVSGKVENKGKRWIGDVVYRYSCNDPSTGNTFSMGPFAPKETRVFDQYLFDAPRLESCSSYIDQVVVAR